MTLSEFDTLRSDLAGLRGDIDARIGGLRADMDTRFTAIDARFTKLGTDIDVRFARLEAKIDEKPGAGTIYQAALAMFAVIIGTIVVLKATGFIH